MDTRDDSTVTRTNASRFEAPALVLIGSVENVVLGFPWVGEDHFGFTPPQFEFQEDNGENGALPAEALPQARISRR